MLAEESYSSDEMEEIYISKQICFKKCSSNKN